MDLIIGGAYQGKCTFAAEKYRLTAADICDLATDAPAPARCYVHLEALTRRGAAADEYVTGEGLALTESSDRFIYTTETRTKIKSDSSDGGGGGSTSSCSGGGGHGRSGSF